MIVSKCQLLGELAKWAIRQSPYLIPDNLEVALQNFANSLDQLKTAEIDYPEWFKFKDKEDVYYLVDVALKNTTEIVKWNNRKNGNDSPMGFTSRYDQETNPDNDFIDLDALVRNVVNGIVKEE